MTSPTSLDAVRLYDFQNRDDYRALVEEARGRFMHGVPLRDAGREDLLAVIALLARDAEGFTKPRRPA